MGCKGARGRGNDDEKSLPPCPLAPLPPCALFPYCSAITGDQYCSPQAWHFLELACTLRPHFGHRWTGGVLVPTFSPHTSQRPSLSRMMALQVLQRRISLEQAGQTPTPRGILSPQWGHGVFPSSDPLCDILDNSQAMNIATARIASPTTASYAIVPREWL